MKTKIVRIRGKGRGIIAGEDIPEYEIIEVCELLLLSEKEVGDSLEPYVYWWSSKKLAIALGNGSLYNHCDEPNAYFDFDAGKRHLIFRSLRPIRTGEEITVDYGYSQEFKDKFGIK